MFARIDGREMRGGQPTRETDNRFGRGKPVQRIEDLRLLTGGGRFTDDLDQQDHLHCVFLRSPYAHARVWSVDAGEALSQPGVIAVFSGQDLVQAGVHPIPTAPGFKGADGNPARYPPRHALALDRVRFVGDAVAAVVATSRMEALAAIDCIHVEYEELPAVVALSQALAADATLLYPEARSNIVVVAAHGDVVATQAAFAAAARVVTLDIEHQRLVPAALEPRASIAAWDDLSGRITLHTGNQTPGRLRDGLAGAVLKLPADKLRVLVGDIGGGFGMKTAISPEDVVLAHAARTLRRTVRWRADRSEEFLAGTHARAVRVHAELALDATGRFTALRIKALADLGAYASGAGAMVQSVLGPRVATGVYDIGNLDLRVESVLTNTSPVGPYRGAGRPEYIFNLERLIDVAAMETGIDAIELRRRNMIASTDMPYRNAVGQIYDSGDFRNILDKALALSDWNGYGERNLHSRANGRLRGRGVSAFLEWTGGDAFTEKVRVQIEAGGRIKIWSATQAMGQGLETSYTQLAAEQFGVDLGAIEIIQGDTDVVTGIGSIGSRSLFVGGAAVDSGASKAIEAGRQRASVALEAALQDIVYAKGRYTIAGTDRGISIFELARGEPAGALVVEADFTVGAASWPNGCHVCEIEIDEQTGEVTLARFTAVDDVGNPVNPMIVGGQIHGGIAQGVGEALMEQALYDAGSAQLVTGSLADYCLPRADDFPDIFRALDTSQPCRTNPLGAKGCGESGTVGSAPAVVSAVIDALAPYGVRNMDMPLTAEKIWRVLAQARGNPLQRPQ